MAADGSKIGLQVAVVRNGRVVVDAASGVADPATPLAAMERSQRVHVGSDHR